MEKEKIGKFINELRKEKGITQKELAIQLHISEQAVSKWERGISFPDITMFESLSKVLNVTIYDLFNGERISTDSTITRQEIEQVLSHSISISRKEISSNLMKFRKRFILLLIICVLIIFFTIYQNTKAPTFNVQNEIYTQNVSNIEKFNGFVCEQDVTYTGNITDNDIKNYANTVIVKKGTVAKKIRFYKKYSNHNLAANKDNMKYEYFTYINEMISKNTK